MTDHGSSWHISACFALLFSVPCLHSCLLDFYTLILQVAVAGQHHHAAQRCCAGEAVGGVLPAHRHAGCYCAGAGAIAAAVCMAEPDAARHTRQHAGFPGGACAVCAWGAVQDISRGKQVRCSSTAGLLCPRVCLIVPSRMPSRACFSKHKRRHTIIHLLLLLLLLPPSTLVCCVRCPPAAATAAGATACCASTCTRTPSRTRPSQACPTRGS